MKVGLYFGTFNPIHVGHLIIANHMADYYDFDQVWFVVSPHNPLKKKKSLLEDYHRLAMVKIAIEGNDKLYASDIEFSLEQPSYTAKTLAFLKEKHPNYSFSLLMGEDNLRSFQKWYNYQEIIDNHQLFVYPRFEEHSGEEQINTAVRAHQNVQLCESVPMMKISASFIRKAIQEGKDVQYLLTKDVFQYVDEMNFYKK